MAEVIAYQDPRYGPAQVWTLPPGTAGRPRTAWIPGGPFGLAQAHVMEKGSEQTWADWAQVLSGTPPYQGGYTVEQVPDDVTPQRALSLIRRKVTEQALS